MPRSRFFTFAIYTFIGRKMENTNIEQELNNKTSNKFGFKLKGATLDKKSGICCVEFFYSDGVILSQSERKECEEFVKQMLPEGFTYEIKFVKNFVSKEAVVNYATKYLKENHPSIKFVIKNTISDDKQKVVIGVENQVLEYVNKKQIAEELENKFKEDFYQDIIVRFEINENANSDQLPFEDEIDYSSFISEPADRFIEVSEVEPIVGNLTENLAYYIKDKTKSEENVVLCGKILFIKEFSYMSKRGKNKNQDEEKKQEIKDSEIETSKSEEEGKDKKFFKFTIEDFTGKMSCVFFASKQNYEAVEKLASKDTVIVSGQLEENKYNGELDLKVKNISRCVLPSSFKEEIVFKEEPKNYRYVFPEPVEYYSQVDLFTSEQKQTNEFLLNHDVVVFDFETTGLALNGSDKIIEIGAVKVVKGKIVERFMSFVDPKMHIPEKSTAVHGITDADVKGAPTYDEVLADFYKFTRNCYLSGYNIVGFDCIFLNYFGRKSGYNFDNPVIDVYKLAQKGVRGIKNYKLGTVAAKLNVTLDNAHRAVFDTIATAEVLFKLSETMQID